MNTTTASRLRLGLAALLLACVPLAFAAPPVPAQTLITPNYKDADLGQIVEAVSQVTGKNFIIDPRVKAQVTMLSATPMTPAAFYEAFLAILQVHGFVAVQAGAVYKIVPDANARQLPANDLPERVAGSDEMVTQVVQLRSVSAAQLVPVLRPLMPQYGNLAAYAPTNMLIISDRGNNVNRLVRIIERIDQGTEDDIEVMRLEHASAAEIVRVVNSLSQAAGGADAGAQVKLVADDRTNSVLISGEKSQRLRLRALVAHLDTPLERGGGTVVRYLKYADSEKLAKSLKEQIQTATAAAGAGAAGAQGVQAQQDKSTTIWAEPSTNALVVTAGPKMMRQLMDVVDRLDIRRTQVLVEAIIVEISGNKEADLGINWLLNGNGTNIGAGGFVSPVGGTSIADIAGAALNPAAITAAAIPTGTTFGVGRLAKTGIDFAAILRAVNGISNTNIVSTPSVTTLDNQEATIKVVSEVPFLTGQYANTAAAGTTTGTTGVVNPFQTITRQDVGTILKITPQITDDATILLKIDQEVSSLAQGSRTAVDLITNKRQVSTRVLAGDGEVIVLGGLIEDNLLEGEQNVPFLSKIPLLGQLFKVRNTTKTKTNLLIFIRAKILVDAAQIATETAAKYNYARDIQRSRGKGDAQLLPGEHQPTLPDLKELAPGEQAVLPKSGGRGAPAPLAPPKADETTGLLPGASVPPPSRPLPRSQLPPPAEAPAPDAAPPKGTPP
jgi:general secretion pathway protein D